MIELLVVVTIIVVLLALLVPAMDRAIYQAELARCATGQRAIATAAVLYAMNHKRYYPHRQGVRDDMVWPEACIYNGSVAFQGFANGLQGGSNATVYDDRIMLRGFLSLNAHLNDPLTGKVDYDSSDVDSHNYSTYNLWFGYRFKGFQGMDRIGDRITYFDEDNKTLWRPDILASDRDTANNGPTVQSSHPDLEGKMSNRVFQNGEFVAVGMKFVASFWTTGNWRGPVDLNYAFQDGSVTRYNQVQHMDGDMGRVPESNMGFNGWWVTVPPQR